MLFWINACQLKNLHDFKYQVNKNYHEKNDPQVLKQAILMN